MKFYVCINGQTTSIDIQDPKIRDPKYGLLQTYFDPEVLTRYRSRPSLYVIRENSSITCRKEDWILLSCYISSHHEIHCNLYDLSLIPEYEQAHWQSYNLQSHIGTRNTLSVQRDLYCSFDNSSKQNLEEALNIIQEIKVTSQHLPIWEPKEPDELPQNTLPEDSNKKSFFEMMNEINVPLVEEKKHYRDNFLLPMSRLVIEGFIFTNLKAWATELKISLDEKDRSLVTLKKCIAHFVGNDNATTMIAPLKNLHIEKSARASHGGKSNEKEMIQKATSLLDDVTKALNDISQCIKKHTKSSP